jgi:hypothetical protein
MHAAHPPHETPKQRLQRIASSAHPFRREIAGPYYLTAIGLSMLVLSLLAVGILGGMLGIDVIGAYTHRIIELSLPTGR